MQGLVSSTDTIAAIATPPGAGGIGIIRLSGPQSFAIVSRLFVPARKLSAPPARVLAYGHIAHPATGAVLDEVLVARMPAPHTYTRQDIAEIQAHGGPAVLSAILALVLDSGARLAEPGEFTRRAFLHGRIDLTQAEAVLDMITAKTSAGALLAASHLSGALSRAMENVAQSLLDIRARLEASLDFPDEVEEVDPREISSQIYTQVIGPLEELAARSQQGQIYREGLRVAIAGRPNVGKSSLMNALLDRERAIVHHLPGTTRDVIEESALLCGHYMILADTAGFHPATDPVDTQGQERAKQTIQAAQMVILVVDASAPLDAQDLALVQSLQDKPLIIAANKSDLLQGQTFCPPPSFGHTQCILVSAKTRSGLTGLCKAIVSRVLGNDALPAPPEIAPSLRQRACIQRALQILQDGMEQFQQNGSTELLSADIQQALHVLGEITGQTLSGSLLDSLFSQFCIGK